MAFIEIKNVRIAGIAAGVPSHVVNNMEAEERFSEHYDNAQFCAETGVYECRTSKKLTVSDLALPAARRLLSDLGWEAQSVDALLFVSQTPDYVLPATACIMQDRLGMSRESYAADISLGCSGWVYGLSQGAALLQNGDMRRALVVAGDAKERVVTRKPLGGDPLFGSAATVTAIEYAPGEDGFRFHFGTDGSGFEDIITPDGGARNPVSPASFDIEEIDGRLYNRLQTRMKGMNVFSFAISTVPSSVKRLAKHYGYDYRASDYFILHQSNKKIIDMVAKLLRVPAERVPVCMDRFGNTSSASIPLTVVANREAMAGRQLRLTCCGYGVGLSWGTVTFATPGLIVSQLVEVDDDEAWA